MAMEKIQTSEVIVRIPPSIAADIGNNEIIDLLLGKALGKKDLYKSKINYREFKEVEVQTHVFQTKIRKRGYLELKNLPFKEGTTIEISISKKERKKNLQNLINNNHVWTDEDIIAIERGRTIINQWKIS
jgi:hypothetical protein